MVSSGGATEKIPSDTTGNRSRDCPTSSAVPSPYIVLYWFEKMNTVWTSITGWFYLPPKDLIVFLCLSFKTLMFERDCNTAWTGRRRSWLIIHMAQNFATKEMPSLCTVEFSARASDCSRLGEVLNAAEVLRMLWERNSTFIANGSWIVIYELHSFV